MEECTLDERIDSEGLAFDYGQEVDALRIGRMEDDIVKMSFDVEKKAGVLLDRIGKFKTKVHRMVDGSVYNSVRNAIGRLFKDDKETSLIEDYNGIITDSSRLHGELGNLLVLYKDGFGRVELLYRKKSIELMDYVDSREKCIAKQAVNGSLKQSLEKKLGEVKTDEGLSKSEIKYGDAMSNAGLRIVTLGYALDLANSKIRRSLEEKGSLMEERMYHNQMLSACVEAYSLCEEMMEYFAATLPLHISSACMVKNGKALIDATDRLYEISENLHEKTREGLGQIKEFNTGRNGKNNDVKESKSSEKINVRSYIKGLIEQGK